MRQNKQVNERAADAASSQHGMGAQFIMPEEAGAAQRCLQKYGEVLFKMWKDFRTEFYDSDTPKV